MRTPIDSDNDIELKGTVRSLTRGRPNGGAHDKETLVTLVIGADQGDLTVDLPIETRTDFDLIPYQVALVGVGVEYSKKSRDSSDGRAPILVTNWDLEILSGTLKGSKYSFNKI